MRIPSLLLIGAVALNLGFTSAALSAPKVRVLLITGDDVKSHKWQEMSAATREVLDASGKFDVQVVENLSPLDSAASLKKYDLVFLTRYDGKTVLSDAAKQNLLDYVKSGKGFAVSHLASASFPEWSEFQKLCGRYWVMKKSGHGPRSVFTAKIADKTHPITKGMADFQTDDELYAKLFGDTPIHVLVEADSDWSKKTEPLAFTLTYGKGRVFHEAFGHDGKAIKNPPVAKLIVQGCEWAAGGKVSR